MDPQRDEPLLRAVVQIALDAPALGVSGGDDPRRESRSSPSRLPFSTASTVAEAAARTSSGSSASAPSITIAATGRPSRSASTHARPRPPAARARPVGLPVARVAGSQNPRRNSGSSNAARRPRASARASGAGELLEQPAAGDTGEQVGLQQRDQEAQRKQDTGADDDPGHRLPACRGRARGSAARSGTRRRSAGTAAMSRPPRSAPAGAAATPSARATSTRRA